MSILFFTSEEQRIFKDAANILSQLVEAISHTMGTKNDGGRKESRVHEENPQQPGLQTDMQRMFPRQDLSQNLFIAVVTSKCLNHYTTRHYTANVL